MLFFLYELYLYCARLKTNLEMKMSASGYKEKAPPSKQEEDLKKLTSLMEELTIVRKAEEDLELAINREN